MEMKYREFDCKKNVFTGKVVEDKILVEDILYFPEVEFTENDFSFEEWLKAMIDAESDIKHGVKSAERDLYELQDEFPKFFQIWQEALYEKI